MIRVPLVHDADPVLPTGTLSPAGLDGIRSPLRPMAVTVSVAVVPGVAVGVTVSDAFFVMPPLVALTVTAVDAVTEAVAAEKLADL